MSLISVIIPVGPAETNWNELIFDIQNKTKNFEIILVFPENFDKSKIVEITGIKYQYQGSSRAELLNVGAKIAQSDYLWFLHVDSKLDSQAITKLLSGIQDFPRNLLYFDLKFIDSNTKYININSWGANIRSRYFSSPFGDQGFCINRKIFNQVGGFPEGLAYGEDHVFVWKLRQNGYQIKSLGVPIFTSARKYNQQGWLKITLLNQYLWIKQAIPEWRKLKQIQKQNHQ